jgi:hypothetical protein
MGHKDDHKDLDSAVKKLTELKQALQKTFSDQMVVKIADNGQWSMKKDEEYWKPKAMGEHKKKLREAERAALATKQAHVIKPTPISTVKPSVDTPYVNIPGKGRGEPKVLKEAGGGSLQGEYTAL